MKKKEKLKDEVVEEMSSDGEVLVESKKPNSKKIDPLVEKDQKIEELTYDLQRLQAEFENFRKRTEKELGERSKKAVRDFIESLLPVIDHLELAFQNQGNASEFLKGITLTVDQFKETLEKSGLEEIKGDKFDPYLHQALLLEESDEDGKILEVLQKGYIFNGSVIRHSKVKVGKLADNKGDVEGKTD